MRQYSAPSPTRYDPVIVNSQATNAADAVANLKEYETQVLAMAVPPDGDDDLQLDFSAKNHAFSLDNVSYITHKEQNGGGVGGGAGGQASPSHSEATTATIATLRRNNNNNNNNNLNNHQHQHNNIGNHHNNNSGHGLLHAMNNRNQQNAFNRTLEMNARNNANPLAAGTLPGTLTLGRIKHQNTNHYQNGGYKLDTVSRNNLTNLQHNNAYSTMGRRGNTFGGPTGLHGLNGSVGNGLGGSNGGGDHGGELMTNTLGRNNHRSYADLPITNPLFQR